MTEHRIRYWQQVDRPGCIHYTYDHWPASEDEMEADHRYREVTVTPVVPGEIVQREVTHYCGPRTVYDPVELYDESKR